MAKDQDPLEDEAPDPTESDTPEDETEDTAEADDSGQSDWTPKDRKSATDKIRELAEERAALREENERLRQSQQSSEDDDGDDPDDDYVGDQNALLAGEVFGPEAVTAANAVWPLLETATTTADYMAVLESYYQARLDGASAADAAAEAGGTSKGAGGKQDGPRPRVDSNRSDRGPDSDEQLAEARKSGNLDRFASSAVGRWFGGTKD